MNIMRNQFTISEIRGMFRRKELFVNRSYQRSSGIWPLQAKSYFIDTVLEGYPFPKVYFYEVFDQKSRTPIREIVDGQQRVGTLIDYLDDKFRLTSTSQNYAGYSFEELPEEVQEYFLVTPVQVDIVLQAERSQLLEMFRRINAYTAPLNPAEKRHSQYQGEFKWFINNLTDKYSPILEEFEVLTEKQILRMADAELLAEFALVLDRGIVNRDSRALNKLYNKYDTKFPEKEFYGKCMKEFFEILTYSLNSLRDSFIMKSYVIHSLFCALMHKKYGIPDGQKVLEHEVDGFFFKDTEATSANLRALADAHEMQETEGQFSDYVKACLSTTHRVAQRSTRTRFLIKALV